MRASAGDHDDHGVTTDAVDHDHDHEHNVTRDDDEYNLHDIVHDIVHGASFNDHDAERVVDHVTDAIVDFIGARDRAIINRAIDFRDRTGHVIVHGADVDAIIHGAHAELYRADLRASGATPEDRQ